MRGKPYEHIPLIVQDERLRVTPCLVNERFTHITRQGHKALVEAHEALIRVCAVIHTLTALLTDVIGHSVALSIVQTPPLEREHALRQSRDVILLSINETRRFICAHARVASETFENPLEVRCATVNATHLTSENDHQLILILFFIARYVVHNHDECSSSIDSGFFVHRVYHVDIRSQMLNKGRVIHTVANPPPREASYQWVVSLIERLNSNVTLVLLESVNFVVKSLVLITIREHSLKREQFVPQTFSLVTKFDKPSELLVETRLHSLVSPCTILNQEVDPVWNIGITSTDGGINVLKTTVLTQKRINRLTNDRLNLVHKIDSPINSLEHGINLMTTSKIDDSAPIHQGNSETRMKVL